MSDLIVVEWVTLDGVIQAPGTADEDRSGGFRHGGWHLRYFDDLSRQWVVDGMNSAAAFLFGRRTYENLAAYWPDASETEQAIAQPLNTKPKYVVTATLEEPLTWHNASVRRGLEAVSTLKAQQEGDIHVIGSSQLVHALLAHDLVDGFRLMIDPLAVGGGKRLFPDDGAFRALSLTEFEVTTTGSLLASYIRK